MKKSTWIFLGISGFILVVAIICLVYLVPTSELSPTQQQAIQSKIDNFKNVTPLPAIVLQDPTSGTVTLDNITLENNTINIDLQLGQDTHWETFTDEILKNRSTSIICTDKKYQEYKDYLEAGLLFKLNLTVQNSPQTFSFSLDRKDCSM